MERPLSGKTVVITRTRGQAAEFARLLKNYGARVIEFPTIEVIPPDSWKNADKAIDRLDTYQWLIFTSTNGVKFFLKRLRLKKKRLAEF